jgi:hypothetical protein
LYVFCKKQQRCARICCWKQIILGYPKKTLLFNENPRIFIGFFTSWSSRSSSCGTFTSDSGAASTGKGSSAAVLSSSSWAWMIDAILCRNHVLRLTGVLHLQLPQSQWNIFRNFPTKQENLAGRQKIIGFKQPISYRCQRKSSILMYLCFSSEFC